MVVSILWMIAELYKFCLFHHHTRQLQYNGQKITFLSASHNVLVWWFRLEIWRLRGQRKEKFLLVFSINGFLLKISQLSRRQLTVSYFHICYCLKHFIYSVFRNFALYCLLDQILVPSITAGQEFLHKITGQLCIWPESE